MSPPLRVALPGSIKETCRLCGAPLEVSMENLQRVCGKCGEVNLPVPELVLPSSKPERATLPLPVSELWSVARLAALAPVVAGVVGAVLVALQGPSRWAFMERWLTTAAIAALLTVVSLVVLIVRLTKPRWVGWRLAGIAAWTASWLSSTIVVAVLEYQFASVGGR